MFRIWAAEYGTFMNIVLVLVLYGPQVVKVKVECRSYHLEGLGKVFLDSFGENLAGLLHVLRRRIAKADTIMSGKIRILRRMGTLSSKDPSRKDQ